MSRVIGDSLPRPSAGVFLLVAPVVAGGVDAVAGDELVVGFADDGDGSGSDQDQCRGVGVGSPDAELVELAAVTCAAFQEAIKSGALVHVGQQELDVAVANARTRRLGDGETWDRGYSEDMSPLVAVAAASYRWGLSASPPYDVLDSAL